MARPKINIDEKVVITMAKIGATNCEIANHFNVDEGTIRKRFSDILIKARADNKIRLRQLQWKLAEQGNLGMLIWLGKQMLGQSEKIEQKQEISGPNGGPLRSELIDSTLLKKELETNLKKLKMIE